MNTKQRTSLLVAGLIIWAAGTVLFWFAGSYVFESSMVEYWLGVLAVGLLCALLPLGLMKWLKVEPKDWLQGGVCLALPGMLGEIPILFGFSELMGNMQPETAGRYAALLFSGYVSLISVTWFMSTKADSFLSVDSQ